MKTSVKLVEASRAEAQDYQSRIPYLLGAIQNLNTSRGSRFFRSELGLGLAEARLMYVLGFETVLTARRASEIMAIDKGATSRALAALERNNLVYLEVEKSDTRQRVIQFTKAGQKLYDRLMIASSDREKWMISIYSESEVRTLSALLKRMHTHLAKGRSPNLVQLSRTKMKMVDGRKRRTATHNQAD
jgi:DNA-binding MarR family transcriptional regulator